MKIKEWKKIMDTRKEVLGSKTVRKAKIGDRIICVLHNGQSGLLDEGSGAILFYAILPKKIGT
jgi:hypothetical protein